MPRQENSVHRQLVRNRSTNKNYYGRDNPHFFFFTPKRKYQEYHLEYVNKIGNKNNCTQILI